MYQLHDKQCGGRFPELARLWVSPLQTSHTLLTYASDGIAVEDPHVSAWLEVSVITADYTEKGTFAGSDMLYEQSLTLNLEASRYGRESALHLTRLGEATRWHLIMENGANEFWLAGVTDGFRVNEHQFTAAKTGGEINQLTFTAYDRFPSYYLEPGYAKYGMVQVNPTPVYVDPKVITPGGGGGMWDPFRKLGDFYGYRN